MLKLDFTLQTSRERRDFVDNLVAAGGNWTEKELTQMADYIMYGKDEDGTSIVDRKEVQIDTKYSSYKKKRPESLDELIESPTFDERIFTQTKYKVTKPKIDRELDADVPGIHDLWKAIDTMQDEIDNNNSLSALQLYKLKHAKIELCRQQFYLRDMVKPTICTNTGKFSTGAPSKDSSIPWDTDEGLFSIAPLGVLIPPADRFYRPLAKQPTYYYDSEAPYIIDFRNPLHIYEIFEHYEELTIQAERDPESTIAYLLKTLDFYTTLAALPENRQRIVELRKRLVPNEKIREILEREFGLGHSANYLSTIFKQKICGAIAEAATLHYDYYCARNDSSKFKVCNQCGEKKLRDLREYSKKSKSSDGLSNRCKKCEKINRDKKKENS